MRSVSALETSIYWSFSFKGMSELKIWNENAWRIQPNSLSRHFSKLFEKFFPSFIIWREMKFLNNKKSIYFRKFLIFVTFFFFHIPGETAMVYSLFHFSFEDELLKFGITYILNKLYYLTYKSLFIFSPEHQWYQISDIYFFTGTLMVPNKWHFSHQFNF